MYQMVSKRWHGCMNSKEKSNPQMREAGASPSPMPPTNKKGCTRAQNVEEKSKYNHYLRKSTCQTLELLDVSHCGLLVLL